MGLDLWHMIPSEKNEPYDYFELDELEGFAERHKHLITDLIEDDEIFNIYIFSDEKYRTVYEKRSVSYQYQCILTGSLDELKDEISQIELDNNLWVEGKSISDRSYIDNLAIEDGYTEYILIEYPLSCKKRQVIYTKEIAYQRKGVNTQFYKDFSNCTSYIKKEDVLRAATYVDPALVERFKADFIDNFVEGESIFMVSW
jgi:hypothetical protein